MHETNGHTRGKSWFVLIFLSQIGASISQFENVFESLDVKTEELNGALDNVYATTIDQ